MTQLTESDKQLIKTYCEHRGLVSFPLKLEYMRAKNIELLEDLHEQMIEASHAFFARMKQICEN